MSRASRFLRAVCLVVLALAAVMAVPAQSTPQREVETLDLQGLQLLGADFDLAQPAAICRLAPECSTNSDCDAICGAGLGRCGHSRCPVRVCKCG